MEMSRSGQQSATVAPVMTIMSKVSFLHRKIKEHSGRVMAVLRVYVDNIHNLEKVEKTLEALGKGRHT